MANSNQSSRTPTARDYDDRFKVSGTTYPADLHDPNGPYGGNYVMFQINVHEDSYLTKNNSESFIDPGNSPPSRRSDVAGGYSDNAVAAALGVSSGLSVAGAGQLGRSLGIDISSKGAKVAGGIAGVAVAASTIGIAKADYKKQSTAISLYMPNDISIKYGVIWDELSLDNIAAMMSATENLGAAAAKIGAGAAVGALVAKGLGAPVAAGGAVGGIISGTTIGGTGDNLSATQSIAMAQALKIPGAGGIASKSTGLAVNPKKEQVFKQVDFRTFTFSYQFFPRSPEEAQSVRDIIKQFKLHMHPEYLDSGQFLYIFPSEFDIIYYTDKKENLNLHRHTSCVLTDMNVSYAPQGTFNAFAGGMPSQINMQLTFRELSLLTKQDIDNGY